MTTGAANQNLVLDLWGQCSIDARYLTENGKQKENEKKKTKKKKKKLYCQDIYAKEQKTLNVFTSSSQMYQISPFCNTKKQK